MRGIDDTFLSARLLARLYVYVSLSVEQKATGVEPCWYMYDIVLLLLLFSLFLSSSSLFVLLLLFNLISFCCFASLFLSCSFSSNYDLFYI